MRKAWDKISQLKRDKGQGFRRSDMERRLDFTRLRLELKARD